MSDKLTIQLTIGKQSHSLTIHRDQEETFRKAARNINDKLNRYITQYPTLGQEKCTAITMLDFAVYALMAERDNSTEPYSKAVDALILEIEEALGIQAADANED